MYRIYQETKKSLRSVGQSSNQTAHCLFKKNVKSSTMSDISDDPPKRKWGEFNRFFHGQSWTFSEKK